MSCLFASLKPHGRKKKENKKKKKNYKRTTSDLGALTFAQCGTKLTGNRKCESSKGETNNGKKHVPETGGYAPSPRDTRLTCPTFCRQGGAEKRSRG